jgi:hypothetical protein
MKQQKSYTINTHDKTITLHRPMTENELCLALLRDEHGDLVERAKWELSEESIRIIRDGVFTEAKAVGE